MSKSVSLTLAPLCAAITLFAAGCGGDRPPLAEAAGTVTLDGAPVEDATVVFSPVAGGRASSAITDERGFYSIRAYSDAEGAPVGEHKVAIIKRTGAGVDRMGEELPADDGGEGLTGADSLSPDLGGTSADMEDADKDVVFVVPKKYQDARESGLTATVPSGGSKTIDFALTR